MHQRLVCSRHRGLPRRLIPKHFGRPESDPAPIRAAPRALPPAPRRCFHSSLRGCLRGPCGQTAPHSTWPSRQAALGITENPRPRGPERFQHPPLLPDVWTERESAEDAEEPGEKPQIDRTELKSSKDWPLIARGCVNLEGRFQTRRDRAAS